MHFLSDSSHKCFLRRRSRPPYIKTAAAACGASVNHSADKKGKRHGKRRKCFRKSPPAKHPPLHFGKIEKIFILFVIASMIGWFYELAFYLIAEHRIANHGFFYGPYLPYTASVRFFILLYKLVQKISDSGISSLDPGDRYSRILHGACHVQNMACALVGTTLPLL